MEYGNSRDTHRLLPEKVPLPTMWSEEERMLLVGTSLEVSDFVGNVHLLGLHSKEARGKVISLLESKADY